MEKKGRWDKQHYIPILCVYALEMEWCQYVVVFSSSLTNTYFIIPPTSTSWNNNKRIYRWENLISHTWIFLLSLIYLHHTTVFYLLNRFNSLLIYHLNEFFFFSFHWKETKFICIACSFLTLIWHISDNRVTELVL